LKNCFGGNLGFLKRIKKIKKSLQLVSNKIQGKLGEDTDKAGQIAEGKEVRRTGVGHDFKVRTVDFVTGKKGPWIYREIKTGRAKLTAGF
jgi:hypothetical protein